MVVGTEGRKSKRRLECNSLCRMLEMGLRGCKSARDSSFFLDGLWVDFLFYWRGRIKMIVEIIDLGSVLEV